MVYRPSEPCLMSGDFTESFGGTKYVKGKLKVVLLALCGWIEDV